MNNPLEQKLEHIIARMRTDTSVDAPADTMKYAKDLFRSLAAVPKMSVVRRVLAVIKIDLAPNRAAFGERSAAGAQARQMLFDSGENAIDLRITATDDGFDIRGQLLGGGFELGEVVLSNDDVTANAAIDEMSGFRLQAIPAGDYSLVARGGDREIAIESLKLE